MSSQRIPVTTSERSLDRPLPLDLLPLFQVVGGEGRIEEVFAVCETMPFGLELEELASFAMSQFSSRMARIERAAATRVAELETDDDGPG